jgi:hypothetical protein
VTVAQAKASKDEVLDEVEPEVDVPESEQIVPGLVAARVMRVFGRVILPGEPITLDVYNLRRFEAIKRAGYIKEVPVR